MQTYKYAVALLSCLLIQSSYGMQRHQTNNNASSVVKKKLTPKPSTWSYSVTCANEIIQNTHKKPCLINKSFFDESVKKTIEKLYPNIDQSDKSRMQGEIYTQIFTATYPYLETSRHTTIMQQHQEEIKQATKDWYKAESSNNKQVIKNKLQQIYPCSALFSDWCINWKLINIYNTVCATNGYTPWYNNFVQNMTNKELIDQYRNTTVKWLKEAVQEEQELDDLAQEFAIIQKPQQLFVKSKAMKASNLRKSLVRQLEKTTTVDDAKNALQQIDAALIEIKNSNLSNKTKEVFSRNMGRAIRNAARQAHKNAVQS